MTQIAELRITSELPPLIVARDDYEALADLALAAPTPMASIGYFLLKELDRATIVEASELPARVVRLGSTVRYADGPNGRERTITLVKPAKRDPERSLISVFTPIGAALIGLSEGQSIRWRSVGAERTITIMRVVPRCAEETEPAPG
jgi:regulator of nucleoside diphosphate kinase